MKSLRQLLPRIEANYLLPAWLLTAITAAAVAETWTVGVAVEEVYGLRTGWAIGGVVASAQAIGSMMWARASQHNSARTVRYKAVGPKGDKRRVEDHSRSEPALNVRAPMVVSITAGAISFGLGLALYAADGTISLLDIALAFASPAGSVAAAMLNGIFTAGEVALDQWRTAQSEQITRASARATAQPAAHPLTQPVASAQPTAQHASVRPPTTAQSALSDTSSSIATHLAELRERAQAERMAGRANNHFSRADVQRWLGGISKTYALQIINYGRDRDILKRSTEEKDTYQFTSQS